MIQPGEALYQPSIDQEHYNLDAARDPHGAAGVLTDMLDEVLYGGEAHKPRGDRFTTSAEGSEFETSYDMLVGNYSDQGYAWPLSNISIHIRHEKFRGRTAIEEAYTIKVEESILQQGVGGAIKTEYTVEKIRGEHTVVTLMELAGVSYGDWPEAETTKPWRRFRSVVEGELEPRDMCQYDIEKLFDLIILLQDARRAEAREDRLVAEAQQ